MKRKIVNPPGISLSRFEDGIKHGASGGQQRTTAQKPFAQISPPLYSLRYNETD